MEILLNHSGLIISFILLTLGYFVGKQAEKKHYKDIKEREKKYLHIPVVSLKTLDNSKAVCEARLHVGSVVVSVDYYKRFLAYFRNLFGGELTSYSSLIDRGRREAKLRMIESCPEANMFLNFRFETATVSKGKGNKSTGCVEVLAYGTAIIFQK